MEGMRSLGGLKAAMFVLSLVFGTAGSADAQGVAGVFCGNGNIDARFGEQCDGGNLGGATCRSQGFDAGELECTGCRFDTSDCFDTTCGNGVAEGSEACDGADLAGKTCTSQGFPGGTLACKEDCTLDTASCATAQDACPQPANGWFDPAKLYGFGSGPASTLYCEPGDILVDGHTSCDAGFWVQGGSHASRIVIPPGQTSCGKSPTPSCPAETPCLDTRGVCGVCCGRQHGWHGECTNVAGENGSAFISIRCLKP